MATLVTGGTGFVGANIVRQLARAGHRVVSYDLAPADPLVDHFVRDCADGITFVQGDILDEEAVARLGADFSIDKIVHAAVYTVNQTGLEIERSKAIADINFTGTVNLLELARTLRVGRFVYVSSGAAYGMAADNDQTFNEEMPAAPNTLYGITKYASELLTRRYGELHGISTASVRLSTPYGPMERVTGHRAVMSVLYEWTRQAVRGEDLTAHDLDEGRDYTYAADTASGVRAILDAPELPHDLYNLTSGVWVTFRRIVETLRELSPGTAVVELPPSGEPSHSGAPARGPLSGHRLHQDLGWAPAYDLRSGLADYLAWRRDSGFLD